MGNTNLLQSMLDRGFGLYSINDALSLKIHDGMIELCITSLPGWDDPVFVKIASRDIEGITGECFDFVTQYMFGYLEMLQRDILNL